MAKEATAASSDSLTWPASAQEDLSMSTIQKADRIVVLEAGRIVDIDRHDEVMARGGLYAKLVAMQFELGATGLHLRPDPEPFDPTRDIDDISFGA